MNPATFASMLSIWVLLLVSVLALAFGGSIIDWLRWKLRKK